MFKWFRKLFESVNIKPTATPVHIFIDKAQEDPKVHESIKRTRQAFKDQRRVMDARALKRHAADCENPDQCQKPKCFKWEPDKIVSKPKVVETADQVKQRMAKKKFVEK